MFKTWREYFHFSYLNEATLDPKKTYIFVEFPHGVFPMSELIAGGFVCACGGVCVHVTPGLMCVWCV